MIREAFREKKVSQLWTFSVALCLSSTDSGYIGRLFLKTSKHPQKLRKMSIALNFFFIEGFPNDDGDDDDDDDDDDGNLVFALPTSTMYITIACTS